MPKSKKVNLNKMVEDKGRCRQTVIDNVKMKIHFHGMSILNALIRKIKHRDTVYVMGCCAWLTNKRIIEAMSVNLKGVSIICTKDKITMSKSNQSAYRKLKPLQVGASPINYIGAGRGFNRSLMHHKFLVGLDAARKPIWCSTGSFNLTTSAVNHLENCLILESEEVARAFKEEFIRLYPLSRPLKIK